jgi:hypothetical protein
MNSIRNSISSLAVFSTALLVLSSPVVAGKTTTDDKTTSTEVQSETIEALKTIKTYTLEQKDQAVASVGAMLDDLDARMDDMQQRIEGKWDQMDQASRERINATLKKLRRQRNELSEWYGGMKHSSAKAWDHVKEGFAEGYESLVESFDSAEDEFDGESGKES